MLNKVTLNNTVKEKQTMTNEYLKNNEFKTDELGRIIIEDLSLLVKINGAIACIFHEENNFPEN